MGICTAELSQSVTRLTLDFNGFELLMNGNKFSSDGAQSYKLEMNVREVRDELYGAWISEMVS